MQNQPKTPDPRITIAINSLSLTNPESFFDSGDFAATMPNGDRVRIHLVNDFSEVENQDFWQTDNDLIRFPEGLEVPRLIHYVESPAIAGQKPSYATAIMIPPGSKRFLEVIRDGGTLPYRDIQSMALFTGFIEDLPPLKFAPRTLKKDLARELAQRATYTPIHTLFKFFGSNLLDGMNWDASFYTNLDLFGKRIDQRLAEFDSHNYALANFRGVLETKEMLMDIASGFKHRYVGTGGLHGREEFYEYGRTAAGAPLVDNFTATTSLYIDYYQTASWVSKTIHKLGTRGGLDMVMAFLQARIELIEGLGEQKRFLANFKFVCAQRLLGELLDACTLYRDAHGMPIIAEGIEVGYPSDVAERINEFLKAWDRKFTAEG